MAFRRSLSVRATIVARQCHPWISHILHDDGDRKTQNNPISESFSSSNLSSLLHNRCFGNGASQLGFGFSRDRRFLNNVLLPSSSAGIALFRYMSTTIDDGSDKFGIISDVISDSTVQSAAATASSQVAAANEVVIAAADSYFPVMMLQHVIDGVHNYAGVNWWAAIALTTVLIRASTIPLLINTLKSTIKLSLIRPRMEELKNQIQDGTLDTIEGQRQMKNLFKEHGVSPFSPLKGLFIQGPIFCSFFFAIRNMVEKVPSFQTGGAYWFVDLTTPDALYIFPVLTALTFLVTVECNVQEGMEGNPMANTMKKFSRILAVLTVPFTMGFPKAIFCYWITSNVFSLAYGLVIKRPAVKEFLGIPKIPVTPPSNPNAPPPSFSSFFSELKKQAEKMAQQDADKQPQISSQAPTPKPVEHKVSSSSVISQRLRTLEKQVMGRKKNKRR